MNLEPAGQGAYLFDTEGKDEMLAHDEGSQGDQNMDNEAREMLRSWDLEQLQKGANEHYNEFVRDRGTFEDHYYEGDQDFDELKKDMEEAVKDTLWIKKEVTNATGREVTCSSTIQFDRIGYIEYNPIPIESTIHDGRPTISNLNDSMMPGLIQGLLCLREGESAYLLISPRLLFGALGSPPSIPPHAYMLYYVRIHKVWEESDMEAIRDYERAQSFEVPLQEKIELCIEQKDAANKYLIDNKPKEALVRYKAAIQWIEETAQEERNQSAECRKLMEILYQNIAIAQNKLEMYKSASKAAKSALRINSENVKAIYQLAKARMKLGDQCQALAVLKMGRKIAPGNASLLELRSRLDLQLREEKVKRDEILVKMSKACF